MEEHSYQEETERLVRAYSDLVLRLSYTYLKSTHDAQDICQTVFLKLLRAKPDFDGPVHEKAWIIRTTANACKDALRGGFRRKTVGLDTAAEAAAPSPPESGVLDKVMALSSKYREAIYLHYFEGYSVSEIAELTGRSIAAVSAHLSRGRAKLRTVLKGVYGERGI
ncbi:MAG: RNA polymerase sigma factor [Gordonibacter sp.]|uniref:RNA polymerase sigma factor n=1 Tax=Gordonibacter sp. TaxID=1968902 RepID=UPI0032207F07